MARYALGIDYGTSSCRGILVDLADGAELAAAVYYYPHGVDGVIVSPTEPDLARQHPADYLAGLESVTSGVIAEAKRIIDDFVPAEISAVGFATTGSTPLPVDAAGVALALMPEFDDRHAAMAWLWKDHTAHAEASAITEAAWRLRPDFVRACGGTYSAEWFWAKIWHCASSDPDVFAAAYSWVELCDYLAGALTGTGAPAELRRSITAAGHKAMYADAWGGLPDAAFLAELDPALAALRPRLYERAWPTTEIAGYVTADWAERTGLEVGTPVAVGHFDAHAAGISGGVRPGTFVKVMGTSTCDVTVIEVAPDVQAPEIPGMCGVVLDTMIPGAYTIEAGQSAVGDIFNWWTDILLGDDRDAGPATLAELGDRASALLPGSHGLLALDWFNGNRSVLVDQRLTGLVLGMTLHTRPHEVLRALVEATAYGARRIIESVEAGGAPIDTVVAAGGLPSHAPWMMQAYADVLGRDIVLAQTSQGSALGAAIVAAVAAGEFESVQAAQDALVHFRELVYHPDPASRAVYDELYRNFLLVHDQFAASGALGSVMKNVLDVRDRTARELTHA
jgi:L-ribulokinase